MKGVGGGVFSMVKRILVLGSSQVAVEKLREAAGELQIPGGFWISLRSIGVRRIMITGS